MFLKFCSVFFISVSLFAGDEWDFYKSETLVKMSKIQGWCSEEKALLIMDLVKEVRPLCCVEIGVFSGMSLLPIASSLKYNQEGALFAIDSWECEEARKGIDINDPYYSWWGAVNFEFFYDYTLELLEREELGGFCQVIKSSSLDALQTFGDKTIDFIHFDGNNSENGAFFDVVAYFPKIKDGGYILLTGSNLFIMKKALVFLLERADILSSFSGNENYLLLKKSLKREKNGYNLFILKQVNEKIST